MSFQGSIPIEINHSPRPLARDVSVDSDRPVNIVAAAGANILTKGRLKPTGSITWSIPDANDPQAAAFLAESQRLEGNGESFTLTYSMAGGKFMILNCTLSKVSISTDQDGKADMSWQWSGTDKVGPV